MTTARDIMHQGAECVGEHDTLTFAAQRMLDLDVGALPVCGDDDRLHGIITDRDIVIKCVAAGGDPRMTTCKELAQGEPITISAGADIDEVLETMQSNRIRRLPVIDDHRLAGVISQADLAHHLPEEMVGHFVEAISSGSPSSMGSMGSMGS
jgi:CBS domain-containing protein